MKLRRLCFYTCLSVHRGGLPQCMLGYCHHKPPSGTRHPSGTRPDPPEAALPGSRHHHPLQDQTPPSSRWLRLRTVRILVECNCEGYKCSEHQRQQPMLVYSCKHTECQASMLAFPLGNDSVDLYCAKHTKRQWQCLC